jgi:hydrogenase nickel incorporation protein HypA/HybF
LLSIAYYQNRLLWFLGILAIPVVYLTYRKLKTLKIKMINLKSKKEKKSLVLTIVLLGLMVSILEISYYSSEELIPFFFILGVVCMIIFLYFSAKAETEQKKLE